MRGGRSVSQRLLSCRLPSVARVTPDSLSGLVRTVTKCRALLRFSVDLLLATLPGL
jgi:hypothetical protein